MNRRFAPGTINRKKLAAALLAVLAAAAVLTAAARRVRVDYGLLSEPSCPEPVYTGLAPADGEAPVVGRAGGRELIYHRAEESFTVRDTATGRSFYTGIEPGYYTPPRNTAAVRKDLRKLFQLSCTNFKGLEESLSSARAEHTLEEKTLENGIALVYYFPEFRIGLTVEVRLNSEGLAVRVPGNGIREDGEYGITGLQLLPMFGAVANGGKGFIVYPDGSGSLLRLDEPLSGASPVTMPVYTPVSFDLDTFDPLGGENGARILMPAFAASRGETAVAAFIREGDTSASVTLSPSGHLYDVSRIHPLFHYRKAFSYLTPSNLEVTEISKNRYEGNFAMQYLFLTGEKADITYSDAAAALRAYMLREGLMEPAPAESPKINLHLLVGATVTELLGQKHVTLTKFDEAEAIIGQLGDLRKDLRVVLLGWQEKGFGVYPSGDKAAAPAGGKAGLQSLARLLGENGVEHYAAVNYVNASPGGAGFNKNAQAVYNERKLPITDGANERYFLNPLAELYRFHASRLPYLKKLGIRGIAFDAAGALVYDDYRSGREATRAQTAAAAVSMMEEARGQGMKSAAQSGNAYMLKYAGYLYDLPDGNTRHPLLSRSIPFYQMIVHGAAAYSGPVPGNMASDFDEILLKWIEYGSEPYFTLHYRSSDLLKGSGADFAFATDYKLWLDEIRRCRKIFSGELAFTAQSRITEHRQLADDFVMLAYEGGRRIYINYSGETRSAEGISVEAKSYKVV